MAKSTRPFFLGLAVAAVASLGFLVYTYFRADFVVDFHREAPSHLPKERLATALDDLKEWKYFYYDLAKFQVEDSTGTALPEPYQKLQRYLNVRLYISPDRKDWKKFEMVTKIRDYEPGARVRLDLVNDTSKKTQKVFQGYTWEVKVADAPEDWKAKGYASMVVGDARAMTNGFRGRLLATVTPRILMGQTYPIDLVRFATLDRQIEAKKENLAPSFQ